MYNLSIVILNYLNYMDTIECVNSILEMNYLINGVVIVDNGSYNDSFKKIKEQFSENKRIHTIKSNENLGFAKGNNIGIKYARKKLKSEFVLVVNNDTVFQDKDYLKNLLQHYKKGVGVIGSKIILKNNKEQPRMRAYLDFKDCVFRWINKLSLHYGSCFDFPVNKGKSVEILHGCALLFTQDFFKKYTGFYPRTFLYEEEHILYFMCKQKNLKQVYVPNTWIYHKEDQSSLLSFQNDNRVMNKYMLQSSKYVIWWKIRYEIKKFLKNYVRKYCKYEMQDIELY